MSRITPPSGYASWNEYIQAQQDASPVQTIAALRLLKRNIKLEDIAEIERRASGNLASPSYRQFNTYVSPGTVAPAVARPWILTSYSNGLYRTVYSGYFSDLVDWFDTATVLSQGADTSPISFSGSGDFWSNQFIGYFKATTTETYTFYTTSDDASYVWIGNDALSGFTVENATVNNGGQHGSIEKSGTVNLVAGNYYPIRIQYGDGAAAEVLTVSFSTPTIGKTTNVTSNIFYNPQTNGF